MTLLYRHNTCPVCRGVVKEAYEGCQGDTGPRRNEGKPRKVGGRRSGRYLAEIWVEISQR